MMKHLRLLQRPCVGLALIGGVALYSGASGFVTQAQAAETPAAAKAFEPAAVRAAPGLQCMLFAPGTEASK